MPRVRLGTAIELARGLEPDGWRGASSVPATSAAGSVGISALSGNAPASPVLHFWYGSLFGVWGIGTDVPVCAEYALRSPYPIAGYVALFADQPVPVRNRSGTCLGERGGRPNLRWGNEGPLQIGYVRQALYRTRVSVYDDNEMNNTAAPFVQYQAKECRVWVSHWTARCSLKWM